MVLVSKASGAALTAETFDRLERQLALVCQDCSEEQLLDLADDLHEMIRKRRQRRLGRSFERPRNWPEHAN